MTGTIFVIPCEIYLVLLFSTWIQLL